MPGDSALMQIDQEIRRLEAHRAEVEAKIKVDRNLARSQLQLHLSNVNRSLERLREQRKQWFHLS